eukprot:TRINITY_DN14386_c0_g1_i1.p2 TRINITY_DN14386_c0_g1~~TRINITY_DN14386_c0_g1_i1.p2  ORF type:complete len:456 (+),score=291.91 TRINITY_DN14386_c0_g1_i1:95-1462(+)
MSEEKQQQQAQGALTSEDIAGFDAAVSANAKTQLTMNLLAKSDVTKLAVNRAHANEVALPHYSVRISKEGKATSQKQSGRCWLFAATNVIRLQLIDKYKLPDDFELSQPFLFFWDKFEKANFFLQNVLDTLNESDGSRLLSYLLQAPVNDGGQYDMFVNIVEKHGLVPKSVYPETAASSGSRRMNWLVTHKLREFACVLRNEAKAGKSVDALQALKKEQMSEIYRILAVFLGQPPQKFDWTFVDTDKKFQRFDGLTPRTFVEQHVDFQVADQVSLINDPRNPYGKLYTVEYLGNVVGGRRVLYINVPIEDLKKYARQTLESDKPVWFGCDVGKFFQRDAGIMDLNVFCYENMFDTSFNMTKAERLVYGESLMTHAMVFTGVDVKDDKTRKWRVENSWGDKNGDKGYMVMSDDWFSQFMYQIVVDKNTLPAEVTAILDQEPTPLPAWDPMGSLAVN